MSSGIDEQLMRATLFAAHKHQNQRRKDRRRTPYINHPLTVAAILRLEAGIEDSATLQAAMLHDTVEDTDTTLHEIENLFGAEVASLVDELSDDKDLPAHQRKALQIEHAAGRSAKAAMIKYADKIANLRDIVSNPPAGWSLQRKRAYFDWAKAVIDKLSHPNEALQRLFEEIYQQKP